MRQASLCIGPRGDHPHLAAGRADLRGPGVALAMGMLGWGVSVGQDGSRAMRIWLWSICHVRS